MKHFKSFNRYVPVSNLPEGFPMENIDNPYVEELAKSHIKASLVIDSTEVCQRVLFEQDENGVCWYDAVGMFDKGTVKVVYNSESGAVISWANDASTLFPHGANVVELESIPEDTDLFNFRYNAEKNCVERCNKATYESNKKVQTKLLAEASSHSYALSIITNKTDVESTELSLWYEYMIAVKRTDLYQAVIVWPDQPK